MVNLREQISPKDAAQALCKFESITGGNESMSKDTIANKKELDQNLIDKAIGKLQMLRAAVTEGSISLVDGRVEDAWNLLQYDELVCNVLSIDIDYADVIFTEPNPKND